MIAMFSSIIALRVSDQN